MMYYTFSSNIQAFWLFAGRLSLRTIKLARGYGLGSQRPLRQLLFRPRPVVLNQKRNTCYKGQPVNDSHCRMLELPSIKVELFVQGSAQNDGDDDKNK